LEGQLRSLPYDIRHKIRTRGRIGSWPWPTYSVS
jgi:hypothetical protein